jgi:hypothetical protein
LKPTKITICLSKVLRSFLLQLHANLCNYLLIDTTTGARDIGCNIINIGGSDLIEKKAHLVMGLLWQIIKVSSISNEIKWIFNALLLL